MANIYVRSTDGNNADNGSTWALAKATIAGALAIASSGDNIYVSQAHAESQASAITWTINTSVANPIKIICVNDGAAPPTALATTATVTTTGANGILVGSGVGGLYVYGITFNAGSSTSRGDIEVGAPTGSGLFEIVCESCSFVLVGTGANAGIYLPSQNVSSSGRLTLLNCNIKFAATSHVIRCNNTLRWTGGSVLSGSSTPSTGVFTFSAAATIIVGGKALVEGVDFSNLGSSVNLAVVSASSARQPIVFRNCKLPASWSGGIADNTANLGVATTVELYNCDNTSTNYRLWLESYGGTIKHETTLVRNGGATDGTTPLAWKIVTNSNPGYLGTMFRTPEISLWNTTLASRTLAVEILRDSATNLTDKEIWLEVAYLGSAATPQATLITDAVANAITTASDQTASSANWVTTGMANPNKQSLSVTLTPAMAGFFLCVVVVAKPSITVYVDPRVTVT